MIKFAVLLALLALVGFTVAMPALDSEVRRIVNGTTTTIEKVPYIVSVQFFSGQWCGASILDENTLLTAAHCFDYYFDELYAVTAWNARVGSSYWSVGGEIVEFASITRHEKYNPSTYDFDVAIVKLASNLTFSDSVQPVALPVNATQLVADQDVRVSGWGRLTVR